MTTGGKISGTIFSDSITNGVQNSGELPLAGVVVFVDTNANGVLDAGETNVRSAPDGTYTLNFAQDGIFQIRQVEPTGFAQTTVDNPPVAVAGGATVGNINFGDRRTLPPNQSFVDQSFRDLLGRGADAGAIASFGGALDQGSLERPDVDLIIESSPEFRARQIDQLFSQLLHRSADAGGKQAFLAAFAAGFSSEQIESAILSSAEYFQTRGGNTNTGFATALYQDVLGRPIDSAGLSNAQKFLGNGGSRLQLSQSVQASPEADTHDVRTIFQQLLRRDADAGALATFTAARHGGAPDEQIAAAIASSDEYFQRFCL